MKYSITKNSKIEFGITLFQIKAEMSFGNVRKGDLGGWIEKEENLAQVSGNAWVYGNAWVSGDAQVSGDAWVYGNAQVSLKASFTKGWFIGGDDSGKITDITDKTGSTFWKKQYVLGDYEITPFVVEKETSLSGKEVSVILDGKTYTAIIK